MSKPSAEELASFASKHGHNSHSKVVRKLGEFGWETRVSPYYLESYADRAREVDIEAKRPFSYSPNFYKPLELTFTLFVECKYVPTDRPWVIWFADKDCEKARRHVAHITPLPDSDNEYTKRHHYLSDPKVGKLFASYSRSSSRQTHNEGLYGALNQSLHSMIHLPGATETFANNPEIENVSLPIVVCNSFASVYRVDMNSATPDSKAIEGHSFRLELNYAYRDPATGAPTDRYFLVDVVDFLKLKEFLNVLEDDADTIEGYTQSDPRRRGQENL